MAGSFCSAVWQSFLVFLFAHGTITGNCIVTHSHTVGASAELPLGGPLGGGGTPWPLYSGHNPPGEEEGNKRQELFVPAKLDDPIAMRCCPGDTEGYWYYNVSQPHLVPFIVSKDSPGFKNAAVIVAPGGGMEFLAWHKEGTQVAKWLNAIGISAFVLKYRLTSSPPTALADIKLNNAKETGDMQLQDGQRAVSLVRAFAQTYGINASRVGMMGFSAGGGLASRTSWTLKRAYDKIDEIDNLNHIPSFALLIYGGYGNLDEAINAPPTFIASAVNDQCVLPERMHEYHFALLNAGITSEMHMYSEGRHGYGDCSLYVEGGNWNDVCLWPANAELFMNAKVFGINTPLESLSMTPMKGSFTNNFFIHP